jgi:hypothetical protein
MPTTKSDLQSLGRIITTKGKGMSMPQNRLGAYNPHMTVGDVKKTLLRHFLATLAYRTRRVVTGTSEEFGTFDAGHGVREPVEIISHMSGVLVGGFLLTFLMQHAPIITDARKFFSQALQNDAETDWWLASGGRAVL